jgi:hypothetical protein
MTKTLSCEIWRPIPGWEKYYKVSTHARVLSLPRLVRVRSGVWRLNKEKILKGCSRSGYWCYTLSVGDRVWSPGVHVLMALAFIPNPDNKPMVSHINDVRDDNRLENLEWAYHIENTQRAKENNRYPRGRLSGMAAFDEDTVRSIRRRIDDGESVRGIADDLGVSCGTIYSIRDGKTYKSVLT